MATYNKQFLSESSNGRPILVTDISTPGLLIHTAVSGLVNMDEIWLYAFNNHSAAAVLTVEFGGNTDPDHLIKVSIPETSGLYLVIPGLILNNGRTVAATASIDDVISLVGWVNRIIG